MTKYPRRDEARVGPAMQHYFETGELPRREAERPGAMDVWRLVGDPRRMAAVWEAARAYLLPDWVLEHAGARPAAWWTHDAPNWTEDIPARLRERARQADWTFRQPRRRMGGTGEPDYACLNIAPTFRCGVPRYFLDPWLARYYRGEA